MLAVQNEREWASFCTTVLGQAALAADPRFDSNPRRLQHRALLQTLIDDVLGQIQADEIVRRLQQADIAHAHVNDMQAVWAHPQLQARQRWTTVASPGGPVPALLPPGVHNDFDAHMGPVPALGEHTDRILRALGYSDAVIERWREDGVV